MNDSIQNWSIFSNYYAQIQIIEDEDGDGLSALLFFILNDKQNISLELNMKHNDKEKFIKIIFLYASTLFENILPEVIIMSPSGEIKETLNLKDYIIRPEGSLLH